LTVDDLNSFVGNKIAEEKKYDVIWCSNVLEHVLDPIALLLSFKNLIAKN
jgi:2-polyprenyl-3-methyl-5-hydroxy-6-metoxy-1,4-benzoquinol methylase